MCWRSEGVVVEEFVGGLDDVFEMHILLMSVKGFHVS